MKPKITFLSVLFIISETTFAQVQAVTENQVGISARLQQEIDMTKDPKLGYVPLDRLIKAYDIRKNKIDNSRNQRTAQLLSWVERGPNSDAVGPSNGNTRPGNGKTSGRVRAIFEDLGDVSRKTVWVGGIDGGLWKTNDISVNPATWTPINDFFGNLSIASICQDPTDFNIMYFGTGEKAINADAVRGAGLWISTDHGVNWSVMAGTSNFWNVSKMVCDASGNLYVGCNTLSNSAGLQRFTKATSTWTNITPTGLDARVPDIELSSTGRLHITCGYYNTAAGSSGYRFTDNPATVTSATWTSPTTTFTTQYNVDLSSNGNTLYALPANSAFEVATIYKSTNGGANWSPTAATPASLTNGQAWYDMIVGIDPNNANNVIVGGLDCYRSINGGTSWTKISNWVGTTGQYVHADQQTILWNTSNRVLIGSDGGVHLSPDGGTTFTDRNVGLRIKQFYAVAMHPTSTNYFLAGAQDNGVHQLNNPGLGSSVEVTGGDGAFVHIDQNQGQFQWGSYVYNQYRRSTNGGSSWASVNYSSSAGRFINPTDYDDVNNIMYCSGVANAFVKWSDPQSGSTFTSVAMNGLNGGQVSAVKVSPYTNNTVFFGGRGSGILPSLIKATNANATPVFTSIVGAGMNTLGSYISCVELGTDEQNIIVVFSNYGLNNVWVTTDGGTNWSAIDGNLPDMPVRWAMFYPGDNTKAIIATETGIWQTSQINGASTLWDPETGFPNVRTDMLQYRSSDGTIAAATHGRGVFTTSLSSSSSCGEVTGLSASAITATTATVSWAALSGAHDYDVDYKLNSSGTWINAATGTLSLSVPLAGLTAGSLYDYRVRANCIGSTGAYTQAQFTTVSVCGAVTGLTSSAITTNSATINWSALSGALNYDVDYKLNSSGIWINAVTGTTNLSVPLSGLSAASLYDYRVRANCTGGSGAYTQAQFTTTSVCGTVTGLNVSAITLNSATINWSALSGALNYDVDYKLNSSGVWINAATATTNLSVPLSGLSAASLYDYRVRANCSGSTGAYAQAQFTTASVCGTVTGLNASAITSNSATINWSALSGALNYDVGYKLNSSGVWINAATATTNLSVSLSGLSASSVYDYRVRANCSGNSGAYAQAQFTTLAVAACPGPYDVSTNGTISGAAQVPLNTDVKGRITTRSDVDNYKFVITTGGTITLTLTTLPANYDLALLNSNGNQIASSANNGTNSETINTTVAAGTYYARISPRGSSSSSTLCYTLKIQTGTASIQEFLPVETSELQVKIFPNPAQKLISIYLVGDNSPKDMTLYDLNGKLIYKQQLNEMFTTLDIQKLAKSVYLVKIRAKNGTILYSNKFVKN